MELSFNKRVKRENDDENKPMYVEIPDVIIDAYSLHDGDKIEWKYFINCKNQKKTTFTREYNGID
ncbi:hypothetical protein [Methanosphaera sp.]